MMGKILIVEDDAINQDIFSEIFEDSFNVKIVSNGQQALDVVEDFMPDMILLDVMLPNMNGYEVCRSIRCNHKLKNTKIIMVSAHAMESERNKGLESGADDYITKPFDEGALFEKVKILIN